MSSLVDCGSCDMQVPASQLIDHYRQKHWGEVGTPVIITNPIRGRSLKGESGKIVSVEDSNRFRVKLDDPCFPSDRCLTLQREEFEVLRKDEVLHEKFEAL